ncbi:hypothetical protein Y032_0048g1552 [Ancylostoma ceylanicum]|uniref:Uncharacterized protein n=1 Tax=Ancylostoma ceylanicum TaxID=53326 RepID=A0A016U9K6_9BILA|nr:hypothetical protein Y032_0048g1552 [Ancylostoma ceylanicum]
MKAFFNGGDNDLHEPVVITLYFCDGIAKAFGHDYTNAVPGVWATVVGNHKAAPDLSRLVSRPPSLLYCTQVDSAALQCCGQFARAACQCAYVQSCNACFGNVANLNDSPA